MQRNVMDETTIGFIASTYVSWTLKLGWHIERNGRLVILRSIQWGKGVGTESTTFALFLSRMLPLDYRLWDHKEWVSGQSRLDTTQNVWSQQDSI